MKKELEDAETYACKLELLQICRKVPITEISCHQNGVPIYAKIKVRTGCFGVLTL
jgi:hypothetical protein